jgi:hypothetical protein
MAHFIEPATDSAILIRHTPVTEVFYNNAPPSTFAAAFVVIVLPATAPTILHDTNHPASRPQKWKSCRGTSMSSAWKLRVEIS